MKLRNKETGEIGYTAVVWGKDIVVTDENAIQLGSYTSLAELNENWEDYEEPKDYWIIDTILHEIRSLPYKNNEEDKRYEQWLEKLGLKFETKEEAEQAVEKLKAVKRLKDKGFRFTGYADRDRGEIGQFEMYCEFRNGKESAWQTEVDPLLDLLFGGEE